MDLACEIFVSAREFDNDEEALNLMRRLGSRLSKLQKETALSGYQVVALTDPSDFDDEDVDLEIVESVTGGRLPTLYVNLTRQGGSSRGRDDELAALFHEGGMVIALTYSTRID
ncbi:hypothetical protein ACF07L_08560 [Streptomyces anulatus]|uniref:hypothetical protein n=1 Tax=Streptomyces anulatus TaxID=1892 RepID=UPI0036FC0008